jgi:hypothetical protein
MAIAGLGCLTFLAPPLAIYLSPYILLVSFIAELSLCVWLLVIGVDVKRWKEQPGAAQEHP